MDDDLDYGLDSPSPVKPAAQPSRTSGGAGPSKPATGAPQRAPTRGGGGDDDDDVYGDLYGADGGEATGVLALQAAELRRRVDAQAARIAALEADLAAATEARDAVTRERDTLLINISRLYATAREELARRDAAIKEARAAAARG